MTTLDSLCAADATLAMQVSRFRCAIGEAKTVAAQLAADLQEAVAGGDTQRVGLLAAVVALLADEMTRAITRPDATAR